MSEVRKIQDAQFEAEVLQSDVLTLVDFGATWCGPCKKLHPILSELVKEFDGRVKILEMDVGESPETATKFGIMSVPQILIFKDGVVKDTIVGLIPKSKIVDKINNYL